MSGGNVRGEEGPPPYQGGIKGECQGGIKGDFGNLFLWIAACNLKLNLIFNVIIDVFI